MNRLDVVILLLFLLSIVGGFLRGFILQIAGIVGAILALAVARLEYSDVRGFFIPVFHHSVWLDPVAYLLVFFAIWAAIQIVAGRIRLLARLLFLGLVDRLLGALLGLVQGVLLAQILLVLMLHIPNRALHREYRHSRLAPTLVHVMPPVDRLLPRFRLP